MPQVFLSYSRKDQLFVHRLHEALEASGRDAWVDWSDIPPTTEFMREIIDGIAATDTFVFVISPDSVISKVCAEEINCAVEFKKRLVPVLYRDVPADHVHPDLASHNWIYCRDADNFESAFKVLTDAIDTDLSIAEMHTRLLVRARDWENRDRRRSLLLQGRDLEEAEKWLVASTGKRPYPLPLHTQYIADSRKAFRSRYRQTLYLSIALLVFFILLSFFLLLSLQTAVGRSDAIKSHLTQELQMRQTMDNLFGQVTSDAATITSLTGNGTTAVPR